MAVSWYQNSAEAKALYLQGYNTAKYQLDEHIKKDKGKKKLAIALDLDETVLDNSPYQGYASMHDTSFQKDGMNGLLQRRQNLFMAPNHS